MRALAAVTALFIFATPALAADERVDVAVKLLQAIGSDPGKLARYCRVMRVVESIQDRVDELETRIAARLDQALGSSFKAAREFVQKIDDEQEKSPDSKTLTAALDELSGKCPD